jgi:uracil-DNA glycosylase family 4
LRDMGKDVDWHSTQGAIGSCRRCADESVLRLRVPNAEKRKPPFAPMSPVRLYFVSVAPPWGGSCFWDETTRDSVREGLFKAIQNAVGTPISSCLQFRELRFFLTPMVKCPSEKDARDHAPSPVAVRNCVPFLLSELQAARPERILALGKVPFGGLCSLFGLKAPKKLNEFRRETFWVQMGAQQVPLAGTYFPGNNRHNSFALIENDILRILAQDPG